MYGSEFLKTGEESGKKVTKPNMTPPVGPLRARGHREGRANGDPLSVFVADAALFVAVWRSPAAAGAGAGSGTGCGASHGCQVSEERAYRPVSLLRRSAGLAEIWAQFSRLGKVSGEDL